MFKASETKLEVIRKNKEIYRNNLIYGKEAKKKRLHMINRELTESEKDMIDKWLKQNKK